MLFRKSEWDIGRQSLRVKIKSLQAESRIIRQEESRFAGDNPKRSLLRNHRITEVRSESRSAQLAYAFLRGKKLSEVEAKSKKEPDIKRIESLVKKYGAWGATDKLTGWFSESHAST